MGEYLSKATVVDAYMSNDKAEVRRQLHELVGNRREIGDREWLRIGDKAGMFDEAEKEMAPSEPYPKRPAPELPADKPPHPVRIVPDKRIHRPLPSNGRVYDFTSHSYMIKAASPSR